MLNWFERMFRDGLNSIRTPGSKSATSAGGAIPLAPAPSDATTSTIVGPTGRGAELLILDTDPLDNENFYLGSEPIDPLGE